MAGLQAANPLSGRRTSVSPVLKSASRPSLCKMGSSSVDGLARLPKAESDISLRPAGTSGARFNSSVLSAPVRPDASSPFATAMQRSTSTRDTLRRTSTMPLHRLGSPPESDTLVHHAQVSRASSANFSTTAVRRSSQIEAQDVQVLKRSVSVLSAAATNSANSLSGSPPTTPSLLEIRSQIPCRNLKQTGSCHFGARCHYRHDLADAPAPASELVAMKGDDDEIDNKILGIRKEIPCRNFLVEGHCVFGPRCFYKHCDAEGNVVEETGLDSKSAVSMLCFPNPHGDGDVSAAGVIPYIPASRDGDIWAVLQVEDMLDEENNVWKPALGLFGGKVGPYDKDWLHTAAREFMEETGELVGDLDSGIPAKMSRFQVEDEDEAFRYTKYLEYSKYQVLYYPVEEADREHIRSLPRRYTQTFKGEISADWTRAATRLEPVILRKDSELGWAVYDIQTMQRHELPSKVPLLMALKAAEFPPMPAPLEPQHLPSLADILGDELDQLLNIRCDTGVKKSKPSKRKSRASKPNSSLRPLSESKSENMFALLAGHSSNEVMCV